MPSRWLWIGLSLFLLSAAIAAGVAPQPAVAWPRFIGLCLAGGVALVLAVLPNRWGRRAAAVTAWAAALALIGGSTTLYGDYWTRNTVGGAAALTLPFAIAAVVRPPGGRVWRWLSGAAVVLIGAQLARSGSRGALLGVLVALTIGALWWASRRWGTRRLPAFVGLVAALVIAGVVTLAAVWPWFAPLIDGVDVGGSDMGRLSIWRETAYLIAQAPFTGWGGGAFEGAYALYGRLIRVPLYSYAHHLYLGIAFEQGLFGLAAWLGLWVAALVSLLRADVAAGPGVSDPFRLAALISAVTLGVHGLFDDPVFAAGGALPFLFVWAGLAALLSRSAVKSPGPTRLTHRSRGWVPVFGAVGLVLLVATFLMRDLLTASWHVNRAVNALAAQEIATWPTIMPVDDPAPALADLEAALQADSDLVSARFRRGLLALNAGDYAAARADLGQAFAVAPESRAVLKALGYARLWSGDVDGAAQLLGRLPEIPDELNAFAFFWESQSQPALSQNARALAAQLTP